MFLNRKESLFQKTARLQSKKLSPGQGKLIKDLLSFPAITWRDVTRFSNSQITTTTSMGNFLRDRKILCAAILLNEVTAAVCTCAHVNTHTHTYIHLSGSWCGKRQNDNIYKRFSLHIHFPAEPSAITVCEMSGSMAKLIGSNGTICYACGAVPGLTHPSQALSGVCSPPPPSKTSIFGHLYMAKPDS